MINIRIVPSIQRIAAGLSRRQAEKRALIRKMNARMAVLLQRWVDDNIKSEGGKVGGWVPFKHGGRRERGGAINYSAKLLQRTGVLRRSFQPKWDDDSASIGSQLPRALYHHHGTRVLPARRLLPQVHEGRQMGQRVIADFMKQMTRRVLR